MKQIVRTIEKDDAGIRLDKWMAQQLDFTRSAAQKLLDEGQVLLNGKTASKNDRLKENDQIDITVPDPVELEVAPQDLSLDIVYEDDDLLVVNKPKGMVVHPAAGNPDNTLVNGLLYHCRGQLSGINGVIRPGILHRIDKNTSGLLLVAKNDQAHVFLSEQLKDHTLDRVYRAVVYGNLKEDTGRIEGPIGRNPKDRQKMAIVQRGGKEAATNYRVIERYQGFTHVELKLETGRTHQIRVHMASIGHPVAGDDVYGPKKVITSLHGQCLHAKTIGFIHPKTHEHLFFDSELPDYFTAFLEKIAKGVNLYRSDE